MFVFLFENVKLHSIIIIGGTNECCSACSNNRTNTMYKTHFFTQIFTVTSGVHPIIQKARNLGCFTIYIESLGYREVQKFDVYIPFTVDYLNSTLYRFIQTGGLFRLITNNAAKTMPINVGKSTNCNYSTTLRWNVLMKINITPRTMGIRH